MVSPGQLFDAAWERLSTLWSLRYPRAALGNHGKEDRMYYQKKYRIKFTLACQRWALLQVKEAGGAEAKRADLGQTMADIRDRRCTDEEGKPSTEP